MMSKIPSPVALQRTSDLGTTMSYMGSLMSFLARSEDTGGRLALVEFRSQPGTEPPAHLHEWENELCYVLEGKLEFYTRDDVLTVGPGEVVFAPCGEPHSFYIRSPFLRMLILAQAAGEHPVGLDGFFRSLAAPTTSMSLPTDAVTYLKTDPAHAIAAGAAHGIRFLSPAETKAALPLYPGFGASERPAAALAA